MNHKQPVAWAVKDFADGWIIYAHEIHARRQAELTGAKLVRLSFVKSDLIETLEDRIVNQIAFNLRRPRASELENEAANLIDSLVAQRDEWINRASCEFSAHLSTQSLRLIAETDRHNLLLIIQKALKALRAGKWAVVDCLLRNAIFKETTE